MKLYNTLSRKVEDFNSIKNGEVSVYTCGPTVYDHIHIGNLSSFIYADILHRTLKSTGLKVKHVMNFTDVDDKTIARSAAESSDDEPLNALKQLTKKYSDIFLDDMKAVGVDTEDIQFVSATDSIEAMQTLISELYDRKFAYIAEDGVYFSIQAYKDSGKKYGQLTEVTVDNTSHARIRNDEYDKESAHDFALWKLKTGNEPSWEFELDGHQLAGRPGWHIECSAMSSQALGQPFDIHTGGVDLIFPHHENEIAQSTAGKSDESYAKYFVHNEHLLVDGRKMSKSLNNFFTLRDIKEKGYEPLAFRLMVLQGNYRNQSNFTWDNLEAAQNRLKNYRAMADLRWQHNSGAVYAREIDEVKDYILDAMANDLDTPSVLASLSTLESAIGAGGLDSKANIAFADLLALVDNILGLDLSPRPDISEEQKQLISQREQARQDNDWSKSDELRDQLQQQGLGVRDTEHGTIWFRL